MKDYLDAVRSHLNRIIGEGTDRYGEEATPMWMSALDTTTGSYPEDPPPTKSSFRPDPKAPVQKGCPVEPGRRTYRSIHAPRGCSLYWDQPQIVAAHAVSELTGDPRYQGAADSYIASFMGRCVARNGIFLWGNHYYYDAFQDVVVRFNGDEQPRPCDLQTEDGRLHEMRPVPPAWGSFWRYSPQKTGQAIRAAAQAHLFDQSTGGFNRHADRTRSCAFLESGGILVESLCWLAARTGDQSLVERAGRIAAFSHRHRGDRTGLLENNPTVTRWDKTTATSEVGLWASSLLRAAAYTDHDDSAKLVQMAADGVDSFLSHGFDPTSGLYYGRLNVADGTPLLGEKQTLFQPGDHSDPWLPLFPAHDYPMSLAEACLSLALETGSDRYFQAVERWIHVLDQALPAPETPALYAESWGRCIHFLSRAAAELDLEEARELAEIYAERAVRELYQTGMFCGHTGSKIYYAVDGVGYLLLSLLHLLTGEEPDGMGFGF